MLSLIMLRGLPGSGKSSLARLLSENGKWPVLSVDDYFVDPSDGQYHFDPYKNHLAYKQCVEKCEQAMNRALEKIFLDNTFTLQWEMEPYLELAKKYNYQVFVATVENRHGNKNIHGITDEQIRKMAEKYQTRLF